MIVTLLNIASDLTLNIAWWATKTVASGLYSGISYLVTKDNLLEKGCTKNQGNNNDERITLLMNKIDKLLENNLLEKGCTKTNNNILEDNLLEKDSLLEKGCTKN